MNQRDSLAAQAAQELDSRSQEVLKKQADAQISIASQQSDRKKRRHKHAQKEMKPVYVETHVE
jgi:hypothetical protein